MRPAKLAADRLRAQPCAGSKHELGGAVETCVDLSARRPSSRLRGAGGPEFAAPLGVFFLGVRASPPNLHAGTDKPSSNLTHAASDSRLRIIPMGLWRALSSRIRDPTPARAVLSDEYSRTCMAPRETRALYVATNRPVSAGRWLKCASPKTSDPTVRTSTPYMRGAVEAPHRACAELFDLRSVS